jgi:very-short-patch-repair endonuclease
MTRDRPENSRALRRQATNAELALWGELRGRRLDGLKFRRQHPLGPYVVDFCCPEQRLIVEVDGEVHDLQREYDDARTAYLAAISYHVIRFTNTQVFSDLGSVLTTIRQAAGTARLG